MRVLTTVILPMIDKLLEHQQFKDCSSWIIIEIKN